MILETNSRNQGSELPRSTMIPQMTVVADQVMQWETATPVGFPVCMRHKDCSLKKKTANVKHS